MRFRFKDNKLEMLYTRGYKAGSYPSGVIDAFFEVLLIIESAADENDLRAFKSLHFEKLKGKRGKNKEHSLRLNKQYRLILQIDEDAEGKHILILELNKHDY